MIESEFIGLLRGLAKHPASRGLLDDAAVLDITDSTQLVLTHDMLIEGVHYLPDDPPETVAWKLVAVNMSDLAAKGARPLGVLMGFAMTSDSKWECAFLDGLSQALAAFDVPLLGGDTVSMPPQAPRSLGLTAIGSAQSATVPSRTAARPGDSVFVSGTIGDAGVGLALAQKRITTQDNTAHTALIEAYRRPRPNLLLGQHLAPLVHAMADISDGLLIDAGRIAEASGCAIHIAMEMVPLSPAYEVTEGKTLDARLRAACAGDDYRLLFTASSEARDAIMRAAEERGGTITEVGQVSSGRGLSLSWNGATVPLPARLGHQHGEGRL
jgi:thiamine-monophosphate kinase